MIPLSYNYRSLLVRKGTTLGTIGGTALGSFVLASALMLAAGIEERSTLSGRTDIALLLQKGAEKDTVSFLPADQVSNIFAHASVAVGGDGRPQGVAELAYQVQLPKAGGSKGNAFLLVRGLGRGFESVHSDYKIVEGRAPKPGTNEVIVGSAIRGKFSGLEVGQSFPIHKGHVLQVVGIFTDGGTTAEAEVWTDLDFLRSTVGREQTVSVVRVKLKSKESFEPFKLAFEQHKQISGSVFIEKKYKEKLLEGTLVFVMASGVLLSLFFCIAASIAIVITMQTNIAQRTREIGILRAIGFSPKGVLASFMIEALLLSLLGGLVGLCGAGLMRFVTFSTTNFQTFTEDVFRFRLTPEIGAVSLIFVFVIGVGGGLLPALRAARVSPLEAIRSAD